MGAAADSVDVWAAVTQTGEFAVLFFDLNFINLILGGIM